MSRYWWMRGKELTCSMDPLSLFLCCSQGTKSRLLVSLSSTKSGLQLRRRTEILPGLVALDNCFFFLLGCSKQSRRSGQLLLN